jgi:hypothetical protein
LISKQYTSLTKYSSYQCLCLSGYYWEPTRVRCKTVFE